MLTGHPVRDAQASSRGRAKAPGKAVILAGGRGTRLAPYTSILPKPLMPIGDKAILEIIIGQLAAQQFPEITLCVGYLAHLIRSVLDNSVNSQVAVRYIHETRALGTAGPLRAIDGLEDAFVVMNGDVLTTLDYRRFLRAHRRSGNALTIATSKRTTKTDYGVLHLDGSLNTTVRRVTAYEEKPEAVSMVSMGIYAVEPHVLGYVPEGTHFDFPDLVQALLSAREQVGSYIYDGAWFDIGRQEDYELAVESWAAKTANGGSAVARDANLRARPSGDRANDTASRRRS